MAQELDVLNALLQGIQGLQKQNDRYATMNTSWEKSADYTGNYVQSRLGKSYMAQSMEKLEKYTPGVINQVQLYFADNGIFTSNPNLENPIMNLLIQPKLSLANIIPATPSNLQRIEVGFMSAYDDSDDIAADDIAGLTVCEPGPTVGDDAIVTMYYNLGRGHFDGRVAEVDALIRTANTSTDALQSRLFFVGDVRGNSGPMPIAPDGVEQRDIIRMGAIRREMQKVARKIEKYLARQLWAGSRTDAKQNSTPAGHTGDDAFRGFDGLDRLIDDDYQNAVTHPNITGTSGQKALLNSIVYDFSDLDVSGGDDAVVGYTPIYNLMERIEMNLYIRAMRLGYSSVDTIIAMRPETWRELVNYLPKEMMTLSLKTFDAPLVNYQLNDGAAGMFNYSEREKLISRQVLTLNGREYPVVLDDYITYDDTATATIGDNDALSVFLSQIYFIPLRVDGLPVLRWRHADYRAVAPALAPIPNAMTAINGWHDNGRFLSVLIPDGFCFNTRTKWEFALELTAPHLAAKITNVRVVNEYDLGQTTPAIPNITT